MDLYLKKEEDCALGSWTMLLLTTLPSVRPGPVGEGTFWGGGNDVEKINHSTSFGKDTGPLF